MNFRTWFQQMWPFGRGHEVFGQYRAIGAQFHLFLADVALRGGVHADPPVKADLYEAGFDAGRRSHALETIKLCGADPSLLVDLYPKQPPRGGATP